MSEIKFVAGFKSQQQPNNVNSYEDLKHKIRSTFHGLLGYLEIFTDEVYEDLNQSHAELLDNINRYAHHLSDLVLDMLSEERMN